MSGLRTVLAVWSILALALLPVLSGSVLAARTYTWTLNCKGDASAYWGTADVRWDWMQDGQVVAGAGGSASCTGTIKVTGGGDRPANANGFTATLSVFVCVTAGVCNSNSDSVTQSFNPARSFTATLSTSASAAWRGFECLHNCFERVTQSATFTVKS